MNEYRKTFELRWADVDANQHVMHSKYYELGAHTRMSFLIENGYSTELMRERKIGPILFREECIFRKEIHAGEIVTVTLLLTQCKRDGSRWSARHQILKDNHVLAAEMHADLAWMDAVLRKLAVPPEAAQLMIDLPKAPDFKWLD
jgi:acyl-CoA thioester hydrolase